MRIATWTPGDPEMYWGNPSGCLEPGTPSNPPTQVQAIAMIAKINELSGGLHR